MRETTDDVEIAFDWAAELFGEASPFHFFTDPERFGGALRTSDSIWMTANREESFGMSSGPDASPLPEWRTCLIIDSMFGEHAGPLARQSQWDFYTRRTQSLDEDVPVVTDATAITELLERDAPRSSVWPGSDTVVDWFGISEGPRLVAVAALTRWRSGQFVVSSVATAADFRGRGLARRVMRGVIAAANARGIEWLGLGVAHANVVAQGVYRDTGFVERARFSRYGLPEG